MAIALKDLPQSAQYALLKEKAGRKERIKNFIDGIAKNYQATKDIITQKWKDNQADYDALKPATADSTYTEFFNRFNGEQDLIDIVKPEHLNAIGDLLKDSPSDSDIIKELKEAARNKAGEIKDYYDGADGGLTWGTFLIDLITNYYLKDATEYINKKLADNDIKLNELDKTEWAKAKSDLFSNCYSTFANDKQESDLDGLIKGINEGTDEIKELIIKARRKKESNKDDEITKLKADLATAEADKKKIKDDYDDLKKVAAGQKDRITELEKDKAQLQKDLAAAQKGQPNNQTGTNATGKKGQVWQEVMELITIPDYLELKDKYRDFYYKEWTAEQEQEIARYLKIIKNNIHSLKGKTGFRFSGPHNY